MPAKLNINTGTDERQEGAIPLDRAIELLETGQADETICIDFGNGYTGMASGPEDLAGLLQRARGLRLITMMAGQKPAAHPVHLRSSMSALHPLVEEILDALKQSG